MKKAFKDFVFSFQQLLVEYDKNTPDANLLDRLWDSAEFNFEKAIVDYIESGIYSLNRVNNNPIQPTEKDSG